MMNGRKIRPNADPPSFTQVPWNSLTLQLTVPLEDSRSDSFEYSGSAMCQYLIRTLNLPESLEISVRLLQVDVWELTGRSITVSVIDMAVGFGTNDYIVQLEDNPGRNQWARVGYVLPNSYQKLAFNQGDTEKILDVRAPKPVAGPTGTGQLVIRTRVLWKTRITDSPTRNLKQSLREIVKGALVEHLGPPGDGGAQRCAGEP